MFIKIESTTLWQAVVWMRCEYPPKFIRKGLVPLEAILKGAMDLEKWALMEVKDMRQEVRQTFEGDCRTLHIPIPFSSIRMCSSHQSPDPTYFPTLDLNLQSQNKPLFASCITYVFHCSGEKLIGTGSNKYSIPGANQPEAKNTIFV